MLMIRKSTALAGHQTLTHYRNVSVCIDKVTSWMMANQQTRCTSTVSALNYCSRIFFQIPQLSIRSGAQKLFRRFFFGFSQFLTAISRKLAPPSDRNENYVVHLKEQSIVKKNAANRVEIGQ